MSNDDDAWTTTDSESEQDPFSTPRARMRSSLPPSSVSCASLATPSSNITGSPETKKQKRRKKGYKRRTATLRSRHVAKQWENIVSKSEQLDHILSTLESANLRIWDLMEYVFNPKHKKGAIRYRHFFAKSENAVKILDWWMSPENGCENAKDLVHEWIIAYGANKISLEAQAVSRSRLLMTMGRTIDSNLANTFNYTKLNNILSNSLAPVAMQMFEAFSTSRRIITSTALICLGEYSHSNNLPKRMLGLYLYSSGAQRQCISILSTLGLSESYSNLTTKNLVRIRKPKKPPQSSSTVEENPFFESSQMALSSNKAMIVKRRTGTLYQLSESSRLSARKIATTGLFASDYDNVNMRMHNTEQIIGWHDSQENETCATLIPLFDGKAVDLDLGQFRLSFLEAPMLQIGDVVLDINEQKSLKANLVHTILRIIVNHGGPGFQKFAKDLAKHQPQSTNLIPLHKTELHPLPTWPIDESTITGNAEVVTAIMQELHLTDSSGNPADPGVSNQVRFLGGDQLSIARLRALEYIRAGQKGGFEGYFWGIWIPGLFHAKIADAHGTLLNHFGRPDCGAQNPGSLWFHNTRLDRLPITLTSLPTFRTCRNLIFVSLYARMLHCLLLVSNNSSLEEYCINVTDWDTLYRHAQEILDKHANSVLVEQLRDERNEEMEDLKDDENKPTKGDMVFENASLFLRDALITREFNDAIKSGDSGRIVLVLKTWALSFRGSGRTKYAHEMLHLIHNLTHVWPKPIRDIVLKNWVLNPSGKPNRFVEMDLVQEHLNFRIKVLYKAKGSNASWEWLETISPCVVALSNLQKMLNDTLGSDQGTKHVPPDLTNDIRSLMESLHEHQVYKIKEGRTLNDDEMAKDVIVVGLQNLIAGTKNPLTDYNSTFKKLQRRRKMDPVSLKKSDAIPGTSTNIKTEPVELYLSHPPSTSTTSTQVSPFVAGVSELSSESPGEDVEMENSAEGADTEQWGTLLASEEADDTLPRATERDVDLDMDVEDIEDDVEVVVESEELEFESEEE